MLHDDGKDRLSGFRYLLQTLVGLPWSDGASAGIRHVAIIDCNLLDKQRIVFRNKEALFKI